MPKVSIITPAYIDIPAKIEWLNEMIRSVVSQTLADWELIIINDKSPISFDTVKSIYTNDQRIRFLDNAENCGPAKTRNTAVALAQSDCVLPLDSDDLLANNEVLEKMYDVWSMDKSKIVYGNLQIYRPAASGFERGRVVELGAYTFQRAMNLQGLIPVTGMHSVKCHQNTFAEMNGETVFGWKSGDLTPGLEDVEYWIAAGKAGFCGQKIDWTTLVYRRQEESRAYKLRYTNNTENNFEAMQGKIKELHSDIYRGEYPMSCCGKGGQAKSNPAPQPNIDPLVASAQNQRINKITTLDGYDEKDKEWASYEGPKRGRFDILARGPASLPNGYTIFGTGHYFQIHRQHHDIFSARQHLGFRVNQPDPRQQNELEPEPVVIPVTPPKEINTANARVELSTLIRPDRVAQETRDIQVQEIQTPRIEEIIHEPNPPKSVSDVMVAPQMPSDHLVKQVRLNLHVSDLDLSPMLTSTLDEAGYTVEKIAKADISELIKLSGIGEKRGEAIISKAKELLNA